MKRHPALLALSREHHAALKLARHARLAAASAQPDAIARLARQAIRQCAEELEAHFLTEENEVLPALRQAGADALVARTLAEHRALRQLAGRLQAPTAATLGEFAELLLAHVRFEERELFECAQRHWPTAD